MVDPLERDTDRHCALLKVHVVPAEPEDLTHAQAQAEAENIRSLDWVALDRRQESDSLGAVERVPLPLWYAGAGLPPLPEAVIRLVFPLI